MMYTTKFQSDPANKLIQRERKKGGVLTSLFISLPFTSGLSAIE